MLLVPYPIASDPLYQGLCKQAERNGLDPNRAVTLPTMLTALQQGSGRLIRQEKDSGVIALLDKRAWRPSFQDLVKRHLPPAPWTKNLDSVNNWFKLKEKNKAI